MAQGRERTVAIVNDDEAILELLTYNIRNAGYVVRRYNNTQDALELIERPADIALLDRTNIPFSGIELYRRLRSRTTMPIIFLSAWTQEIPAELQRKQLPPADGYISLPFSAAEVCAAIRATLSSRS